MAKELKQFPETRGRRKGESQYDWDGWFNGKVWQLDAGEDFTSKIASFRSTIAEAARVRGIKVRTATVNDGKSIVIQALPQKGVQTRTTGV
jgi:hypothetical protein